MSVVDEVIGSLVPSGQRVARIGLISDTHMPARCAELPAAVFEVLGGVDLVLHAGDVGELWVLDRLSAIAPVVAVHGNDETEAARVALPYRQLLVVGGRRLLLYHGHNPDRDQEMAARRDDAWEPKLARRAAPGKRVGAKIVVYGHAHIPLARVYDDVLLVNPGAIAPPNPTTRQRRQTVAVLLLPREGIPRVIHVDLAAPDRAFVPRIEWPAGYRAALDQFVEPV